MLKEKKNNEEHYSHEHILKKTIEKIINKTLKLILKK